MSINPFVGPHSFTSDKAEYFFGRDVEARTLRLRLLSKRIVLFYAKSGAGKTSLLNAKLIPTLQEEESFTVLNLARVGYPPSPEVDASRISNPFVFSTLTGIAESAKPQELINHTLLSGLQEYCLKPNGKPLSDQTLLVLDQFEELFMFPEQWKHIEPFFEQLRNALDEIDSLGLIISMREDRVAEMDSYSKYMPGGLTARFRMELLDHDHANDAITRPLKAAGTQIEPEATEQLIKDLRRIVGQDGRSEELGQYVEPVHLQVVCQRLWDTFPNTPDLIRHDDVKNFDIDTALIQFYESGLKAVLEQVDEPILEAELRNWFETKLLTKDNTRSSAYSDGQTTAGLSNKVVKLLVDKFLIRSEPRAGSNWYELPHDRMIEPIVASNRKWFRTTPEGQAFLLKLSEEEAKQRQLESARESALAAAEAEEQRRHVQLIMERVEAEANLAKAQAATQRLRVNVIGGIAIVFFLLLVVSFIAFYNATVAAQNARTAKSEAENARRAAEQLSQASLVDATELQIIRGEPDLARSFALEAVELATDQPEAQGVLARSAYPPGTVRVFEGHQDRVVSVALSSDGRTAISGSCADRDEDDNCVKGELILWDATTGKEIAYLEGHEDTVLAVDISADGHRALSASADGAVVLWDVDSGQIIRQFPGHPLEATSIIFNEDETLALSGGCAELDPDKPNICLAGEMILWDIESGNPIQQFKAHESEVTAVAFGPTGETVYSAGCATRGRVWVTPQMSMGNQCQAGNIIAWDVATGEQGKHFEGHAGKVWAFDLSPDGSYIVSAAENLSEVADFVAFQVTPLTELVLWDTTTTEEIRRFEGHEQLILDAVFSPDGQTVLSASLDHTIRYWDTASGEEIFQLLGHTDGVSSIVFGPDHTALSGSFDHTLRLWDLRWGAEESRWTIEDERINDIAYSTDGSQLLAGLETGQVILLDSATGEEIFKLTEHTAPVRSVAFSPGGNKALTGSQDGTLILWNLETQSMVSRWEGHNDTHFVLSVAFSPDGQLAVSGSGSSLPNFDPDYTPGEIILWDVEKGTIIKQFEKGHQDWVQTVTFSPDGTMVLSGGTDHEIILWNVETGQEIRRFSYPYGEVYAVAFSPDSRSILAGGGSQAFPGPSSVILWDIETGEQVRQFYGHDDVISSVAFLNDGQTAISGSYDGTIIVWDVESGTEIRRFTAYNSEITTLALHPDNTLVASGTGNIRQQGSTSELILWRIDTIDELVSWTKENRYIPPLESP